MRPLLIPDGEGSGGGAASRKLRDREDRGDRHQEDAQVAEERHVLDVLALEREALV
jgi:hypothetical protein